MIRSFAIALVGGTQVFTLWFGGAIFGTGDLAQALMLVSASAIDLAVADWAIRRRRRTRRPAAAPAALHRPYALGRLEPSHEHHPGRRTRSASTVTWTTTRRPGSGRST